MGTVSWAISSHVMTIRNKEQGSYWFSNQFTLKSNSCLVLYSAMLSYLRISMSPPVGVSVFPECHHTFHHTFYIMFASYFTLSSFSIGTEISEGEKIVAFIVHLL